MMTRAQTVAVATAVQQCRPEWDHAGIVAALEKASTLGTPAEVAAAAFRLAGNLQARTPGMLHQPGAHWSVPTQGGPTVSVIQTRCGEHPAHPASRCPECPSPADVARVDHAARAAEVRAALRATKRSDYHAAMQRARTEREGLGA